MKNLPNILIIDDSKADVDLIRYSFKKSAFKYNLLVKDEGESALIYLKTILCKTNNRPDLIILDINLPKVNGIEILKFIKSDEMLCKIPVVMLTTSTSQDDVEQAYRYHANAYLVKPLKIEEFVELMSTLKKFMLDSIVKPVWKEG